MTNLSRDLKKLFDPISIAVIGASDRSTSVGKKVFQNLLKSAYHGKLYAFNPKHKTVQNHPCFRSVNDITESIDLAIIAAPAKKILTILHECGKKSIPYVLILSSGFSEIGEAGKILEDNTVKLAKQYGIRIIGPNCLGIMRPYNNMNATFDNNFALKGHIALISQSGALSSGILDWAMNKKIGFSALISIGNGSDLHFSDMLDYLITDNNTHSILLYIEGIHHARQFMSSLRAAARVKPVIIIKAGRTKQGLRAALSHTGVLIGDDDIFDAALRRAGAVRVSTIEEFFSTAKLLSGNYTVKGNRLMIITNGGGAGVMAADYASKLNIELVPLTEELKLKLNKVLPLNWSHQNPIDIIGDATPGRYHVVLNVCSQCSDVDGFLIILVPVAMSQPKHVARQVIQDAQYTAKPIFTCWLGEQHVKSSWDLFEKNKIPCFDTPEKAVQAFSFLTSYFKNQQLLMQVSPPFSIQKKPDIQAARFVIEKAQSEGRTVLLSHETRAILSAFFIPFNPIYLVKTKKEAKEKALSIGFPLVMKIVSPTIVHKQNVGGVILNILDLSSVENAFDKITENAKSANVPMFGVTLERMIISDNAREVMVGIVHDQLFGPVMSFGAGGSLVELLHDVSFELPPINYLLAKNMITRIRMRALLGQFRNKSAVNQEQLINILLRISEMACELPWIQEMEVNPLIMDEKIVMAVDVKIVISSQKLPEKAYSHLAISPYPAYLTSYWRSQQTVEVTLRPIRPEDAEIEQVFTKSLSSKSKYFRFMGSLKELTPRMLARLTQIDYDREMAIIAICQENKKEMVVGIARYVINLDLISCDFSIVVSDSWQNKGLGYQLLSKLIDIAKEKGLKTMMGTVMANNHPMLLLAKKLHFDMIKNKSSSFKTIAKKL